MGNPKQPKIIIIYKIKNKIQIFLMYQTIFFILQGYYNPNIDGVDGGLLSLC